MDIFTNEGPQMCCVCGQHPAIKSVTETIGLITVQVDKCYYCANRIEVPRLSMDNQLRMEFVV